MARVVKKDETVQTSLQAFFLIGRSHWPFKAHRNSHEHLLWLDHIFFTTTSNVIGHVVVQLCSQTFLRGISCWKINWLLLVQPIPCAKDRYSCCANPQQLVDVSERWEKNSATFNWTGWFIGLLIYKSSLWIYYHPYTSGQYNRNKPPEERRTTRFLYQLLKWPICLCQPGTTVPPSKWAAPRTSSNHSWRCRVKPDLFRHIFWGATMPQKSQFDPNQNWNINIKLLKQDFLDLFTPDLKQPWQSWSIQLIQCSDLYIIYTRFHKCCQAYSLLWKWSIFQTKRVLGSSF